MRQMPLLSVLFLFPLFCKIFSSPFHHPPFYCIIVEILDRRTAVKLLTVLLLIAALCVNAVPAPGEEAPDGLTMICLNAGKADCILIRADGRFYLVDTGYKSTSDQMLEMLRREGVDRLAGVFLTHNHKDHYGGLNALCKSGIPIDAFYASAYSTDGTGSKNKAVAAAAKRGQTAIFLKGGDTVAISDAARFDVLAPTRLNKENENNNSLVMRLSASDGSILLTGDMKFEEEYTLISEGLLEPTDVLKVAFHGDNTSTSTAFLQALRPKLAVISTSSTEEKDTPSREVLYRIAQLGCPVRVTQDAASAVRITLTNGDVSVAMEDWSKD